jgi:anthranilate phosphoribosyltransferase
MKQILNNLFEHNELTYHQAFEILTQIAEGKFTEVEIASFLTIYNIRNISINELKGFRDALLELRLKIDLSEFNTIDLCGTGGDGKDTFNISTLSSFVVAGAGYKVAKHGNYGVSSGCGSSNVLEALGYKFTNDSNVLKRQIAQSGICFLHAPLFHPAMKSVAPVRRAMKVKTFFNMLGPMVNPSRPQQQIVGVYSLELQRLYNYMYQHDKINYSIIHSLGGYDEVSLTDEVKVITNEKEMVLSPKDFGFETIKPEEIAGGESIQSSTEIFLNVLSGKGTKAQNNVVLANSALAIQCFDKTKSLSDCIAEANESLMSGKAMKSLKTLLI